MRQAPQRSEGGRSTDNECHGEDFCSKAGDDRLLMEIQELSYPALSDINHSKFFLIAALWHEEKNSDSFPPSCGQKPTGNP